jgi:hypothetical protein
VRTLEQGFKVYWRITFIILASQTGFLRIEVA